MLNISIIDREKLTPNIARVLAGSLSVSQERVQFFSALQKMTAPAANQGVQTRSESGDILRFVTGYTACAKGFFSQGGSHSSRPSQRASSFPAVYGPPYNNHPHNNGQSNTGQNRWWHIYLSPFPRVLRDIHPHSHGPNLTDLDWRSSGPGLQPQPPNQIAESISGLVERATFHNQENGFAVLKVKAKGRRDLVTVGGSLASVSAGE